MTDPMLSRLQRLGTLLDNPAFLLGWACGVVFCCLLVVIFHVR